MRERLWGPVEESLVIPGIKALPTGIWKIVAAVAKTEAGGMVGRMVVFIGAGVALVLVVEAVRPFLLPSFLPSAYSLPDV